MPTHRPPADRRATLETVEMRRFLLAPILLLGAGALRADDVRLENGKTFEGVIVAERDGTLDIQMPGGTISISKASVREIVPSDSPYAEYLSRAAELRRARADAERWLELARWASARNMNTAAREAALEAAALDPLLADLKPVLRSLGYELDDATRQWLPFDEAMRSRGLVEVDGAWITPEEAAEIRRRSAEASRQRDLERLERSAVELRLAAAQMELDRAQASAAPAPETWGYPYAPYGGVYGAYPVFVPGLRPDWPHPHPKPHAPRDTPGRIQAPPTGGSTQNGIASPQSASERGSISSTGRRP
jgi:hypothetical protein